MDRVMFTGVHGIGKSTTAMKLSKTLGNYLYVPSFAGPVAKRMGFDLNKPHTAEQLVNYQERLLEVFIESYKTTTGVNTIYDRSPIDLAAYLAYGGAEKGIERIIVENFTRRCVEATNLYCDILIYPEADLDEPMQFKDNRPVGYDRRTFDMMLDYYVNKLNGVKVIDIPVEYQYDDRVNYIIKNW